MPITLNMRSSTVGNLREKRRLISGKQILGAVLPDWDELKKLSLTLGGAMLEIPIQSWDIAMCPEGPMAMELNVGGAMSLPQLAHGEGIFNERFNEFLGECEKALSERKQRIRQKKNENRREQVKNIIS